MRKVVLAVVLVLMAGGAQAVTLNVIGGQLMGASGVLVGNNLYDVQFLEGTCIDLYNGCDDVGDFVFYSEFTARLASEALEDQVFLDDPSGAFDTSPNLTNDCNNARFRCKIYTPYGFRGWPSGYSVNGTTYYEVIGSAVFDNSDCTFGCGSGGDNVYLGIQPADVYPGSSGVQGPTGRDDMIYAVWSGTPVPEPSTALLLGLGLTGLAAKGRRRNRS